MKIKVLILTIVTLLVSLSCSCGLVEYKKYDPPIDQSLLEQIELYQEKADEYLNSQIYYEQEFSQIKYLVQDAKNELGECETVEELEKIFSKHDEILKKVPTAKSIIKDRLNDCVIFENYRSEEKAELEQLLCEYLLAVNEQKTIVELETLVSVFKTKVSEFTTDETYYKQELLALIETLRSEILSVDHSLYRTAERLLIEEICLEYDATVSGIETKEEVAAYHQACMQKISLLKTDQELSTLGKEEILNGWKDKFNAFTKEYEITDTSTIESTLENQADLLEREIQTNCSLLLISLSEEVNALEYLKYGVTIYMENYAITSDYRKDEQLDLIDALSESLLLLSHATTVTEAKSALTAFTAAADLLPTNEQLWLEEDKAFDNKLLELYGETVLEKPKSLTVANDYTELAAIIDYYAFYQLDFTSFLRDTFRVKLNFPVKTAQWEINEVYWYAELLRSSVGITGYFEENSSNLVITLVPYALATISNTDEPITVNRHKTLLAVKGNENLADRPSDFNDFPYLSKHQKTLTGIWNSQQLWFALEHEYIPVVVKGSAADKVFTKAKEVLREIIKKGMDDEQKVYAIFNWLAQNVEYDHSYHKYIYPDNRELFPDSESATLNSFNAEGALIDHAAVCCGYAKAYLILLRIEAIESYRITLHRFYENAMVDPNSRQSYGSHALVAIKLSDGKFYTSDADESYFNQDESFIKLHQFIMTEDLNWVYQTGYTKLFLDLEYGESLPSILTEKLAYADTSVYIKSKDQLDLIINAFKDQKEKGVQLSVFEHDKINFSIDDALDLAKISYHTFSFGGLKEYILYK